MTTTNTTNESGLTDYQRELARDLLTGAQYVLYRDLRNAGWSHRLSFDRAVAYEGEMPTGDREFEPVLFHFYNLRFGRYDRRVLCYTSEELETAKNTARKQGVPYMLTRHGNVVSYE